MVRPILVLVGVGAAVALAVGVVGGAAAFAPSPSGERVKANSGLEPFYNAENEGEVGILMVPPQQKHPTKVNEHAWSPIYLPVYPVGSTATSDGTGNYLCRHLPTDNCPSHGLEIAGAAAAIMPSVYGDGVAGHDHVMDFPGGADFNIAWEPVLVLFTSKEAANEHLLTDQAIDAAVDRGDAIEVPVPALTFNCIPVSTRLWELGTPVEPVSPTG